MQIDIILYTGETMSIKGVSALDFDGENGILRVLTEDKKTTTYRLIKKILVF